jgi:uncharacterized protein YndB with AHSA1/START domain
MIDAIIEQIEIQASPETVYEAWTTPEQVVEWWGEEGLYGVKKWTCDVRVGGKWRAEGVKKDGQDFSVEGEYLKVDPPKYLSFTWSKPTWAEDCGMTTVELEFQKTAKGTLLKLKHHGFTNQAIRDDHKQGWPRVLGWLSAYVSKKAPLRAR